MDFVFSKGYFCGVRYSWEQNKFLVLVEKSRHLFGAYLVGIYCLKYDIITLFTSKGKFGFWEMNYIIFVRFLGDLKKVFTCQNSAKLRCNLIIKL